LHFFFLFRVADKTVGLFQLSCSLFHFSFQLSREKFVHFDDRWFIYQLEKKTQNESTTA
jgi:hypothetical protein